MSIEGRALRVPRLKQPDNDGTPADMAGLVIARPLPLFERIVRNGSVRSLVVLAILALGWEIGARGLAGALPLPTLGETAVTLWHDLAAGALAGRIAVTLGTLLLGTTAGLMLAGLLVLLAVSHRIGASVITSLSGMLVPLPAIALLPLVLLWFGPGMLPLVLVIVHSVLWTVTLNTLSGFRDVPESLRMSARNYGLNGLPYVVHLLVPAAFPAILAGVKKGWAFAWRTLIAAELVVGVLSGSDGLGGYLFEARTSMEADRIFAGLFAVALIGLLVESLVFRAVERHTIRRWGMQRRRSGTIAFDAGGQSG